MFDFMINTKEEIFKLLDKKKQPLYIDIIPSSYRYHPILCKPVALYYRFIGEDKGYIISINHPDQPNITLADILHILKQFNVLYTKDKKNLLYYLNLPKAKDLQLLRICNGLDKVKVEEDIKLFNFYYTNYSHSKEVNKSIPVTFLYNFYEEVYSSFKNTFSLEEPENYELLNTQQVLSFLNIERTGLKIDQQKFKDVFNTSNPDFNVKLDTVYGYYNLYNITTRPTNAFNSVNFSAIPHISQHRECFIPHNDFFVEVDYDGYHIRLLADLVGYSMTPEPAHVQLGKIIYKKEVLSEEEIKQAKNINFKNLYGTLQEEYKDVEFFRLVNEFSQQLWNEFETNGFIKTPLSGKIFRKDQTDLYPKKLFNYFIQALETANNIGVLYKLVKYLHYRKSKIVLYIYDSIIIDFNQEDGKQCLQEIKNLMSQNFKFPVKIKRSKSLMF